MGSADGIKGRQIGRQVPQGVARVARPDRPLDHFRLEIQVVPTEGIHDETVARALGIEAPGQVLIMLH